MGKSYTTTIQARCQKEHTCVCCGAVYAYPMTRKVVGQAPTQEQSAANAEAAILPTLSREVDPEPCPTCGLLQPDMVARKRAGGLKAAFWIGLITFVTLVILCAAKAIQMNTAVLVSVIACGVFAAWLILSDLSDPNRAPELNQQRSMGRVASGEVTHVPGKLSPGARDLVRFPRGALHKLALVALPLAVLLAAAPEAIRAARGWPLNDQCYPPVVAPGDTTRVYMQDKITSIKGYWRGKPQAALKGPAGAKDVPLKAETNHNDWGNSISAKSSQKNNNSTPWVEVALPADAALAGKTLDCAIDIRVEYPAIVGSSSFMTQVSRLSRTLPVTLAKDPLAGAAYAGWWWKGTVAAMAVILLAAQFLIWGAKALERRAKPTRVLPPPIAAGAGAPMSHVPQPA